jgi:hypothetical protein
MFTNAGLVIRLVIAAIFVLAGLLLLRASYNRVGAGLITVGGTLFLAGELYGMFVLRPFVGRFFDEHWHVQVDIVDALATLGLFLCAGGLVVHALLNKPSRTAA